MVTMNTARMDSLLNRQKNNLVSDTVYALVVTLGMVICLLGLGIGTSPAKVAMAPSGLISANQGAHCALVVDTASETLWVC